MNDRTVTRAHVTVVSEDMTEDEVRVDLAEKLKGYEIDRLQVERIGETEQDTKTMVAG